MKKWLEDKVQKIQWKCEDLKKKKKKKCEQTRWLLQLKVQITLNMKAYCCGKWHDFVVSCRPVSLGFANDSIFVLVFYVNCLPWLKLKICLFVCLFFYHKKQHDVSLRRHVITCSLASQLKQTVLLSFTALHPPQHPLHSNFTRKN